jgi:predicted Zn-dependent protease
MQLSYKARYYNGQTSVPFTADISIDEAGIRISYTNTEGGYDSTMWPKDGVKEAEFTSAVITLRYGEGFPYQQLEITDPDLIAEYKTYFRVSHAKRWMHLRTPGMLAMVVLGFCAITAAAYLFFLPLIADRIARSFPQEYEISLGKDLYASVLQNQQIDSAKTVAINNFFNELDIETSYPVKITVVKDNVVNAFALPGGGIVVYDAILDKMEQPEDLAALLSHEFSHVELKHATRNVFRSLAGYLFISVLFSDVNGIAAIVVQNADNLRNLKYSRDLEHEADENGLRIMEQSRLDPEGMIRLFGQLKREDHRQVSELLSTHPELDARIAFVRSFREANPYTPKSNQRLNTYFKELKGDSLSW